MSFHFHVIEFVWKKERPNLQTLKYAADHLPEGLIEYDVQSMVYVYMNM